MAAREASLRVLGAYDQDEDGAVSAEEFPGSPGRFGRLDSDGDGLLQLRDIRAAQQTHLLRKTPGADAVAMPGAGYLRQHDTDGDRHLDREEFPGGPRVFDRADVDGDGHLDLLELAFRPTPGVSPRSSSPR